MEDIWRPKPGICHSGWWGADSDAPDRHRLEMKKLFKWVFRLAFWLAVAVLVVVMFRNVVVQTLLEHRLRAKTGMEVSIGRVRVGVLDPTFTIEDLRMFNSDDYGRNSFLDVPELHIEYDRSALMSKRIHLTLARLDLAELQIVENDEGQTNLQELRKRERSKSEATGEKKFEFEGIDTLNLALGRFKYSSLKNPGKNDMLYIGLRNQIVHNVKSFKDLEPLMNRLALERNGKSFYDKCLGRGTNVSQNAAVQKGKESAHDQAEVNDPPATKTP